MANDSRRGRDTKIQLGPILSFMPFPDVEWRENDEGELSARSQIRDRFNTTVSDDEVSWSFCTHFHSHNR